MRLIVLSVFLLLMAESAWTQKQTKNDNVVAYFGEDKKVEIHEGSVLYQFDEVFFARTTENYGRSITPSDNLAYKIFTNTLETPQQGKVAGVDREGNAYEWSKMKANEEGVISDGSARQGHFYATYTSSESKTLLLEVAGPTMVFINGMPHEGDHYNYGYTIIPFRAVKGENSFLFTPGRFGMLKARIVAPAKDILMTKRDVLLPDLIVEETEEKWGAIRIVNNSDKQLTGYKISAKVEGQKPRTTNMVSVAPLSVRKVPFLINDSATELNEDLPIAITVLDKQNRMVDSVKLTIKSRTKYKHHERTFVSDFDGSVQYYSVAPSTTKDIDNQIMVLSVHGASVQARNQARAYKQKDWGFIVAPTNRRPHGFAWEEWGRLDAMEVLGEAEARFKTDPIKTYLTGHSMGGHGSWYLGAVYPDRFAAVAPCAGYPELLGYARRRTVEETSVSVGEKAISTILERASNVSRTKKLVRNYIQSGIFIYHGDSDNVVPPTMAREMRELLGTFKSDMAYYEHPGGKHWFDTSVDWQPLFDYFKWHENKTPNQIDHFEFYTPSPGLNAKNHWATVQQQIRPLEISSIKFDVSDRDSSATIKGETSNVRTLVLDLKSAELISAKNLELDSQKIELEGRDIVTLQIKNGAWQVMDAVNPSEKSPVRSGGFKDAFTNRPVFVYATKGSQVENNWYYNKARFDAETFYYRGNSSIELVRDIDFDTQKYADRNVILYGNSSNNAAWNKVLKGSDVTVSDNKIVMGTNVLRGDNLGCYFIQPRAGSTIASVGVVAATGEAGMYALYPNQYFVAGHGFPDIMIVDDTLTTSGVKGVKAAGFFGNDWSVANGEFGWR